VCLVWHRRDFDDRPLPDIPRTIRDARHAHASRCVALSGTAFRVREFRVGSPPTWSSAPTVVTAVGCRPRPLWRPGRRSRRHTLATSRRSPTAAMGYRPAPCHL